MTTVTLICGECYLLQRKDKTRRCDGCTAHALRTALAYAWHNDRTGGHFDYDEWRRLCEALLGEKDKTKAPTPSEMEHQSMLAERLKP